jgi:hypothetical protein
MPLQGKENAQKLWMDCSKEGKGMVKKGVKGNRIARWALVVVLVVRGCEERETT